MEDGFLSIKEDICPLVTMEFIAKIYEIFCFWYEMLLHLNLAWDLG
jgi:hypothetical protein